jgi:hypothetical protein
MKLVAILSVLLFMGSIIFAVFVFPIWSLVHCATSTRSNKSKTWWIIMMILTWPITGLAYGLFGSKQKALRRLSLLQIAGIVIIIIGYIYSVNLLSGLTNIEIARAISKTQTLNAEGLTKGDLEKLRNSLGALKGETQPKIFQSDKLRSASSLMQLFYILVNDNKLTLAEYKVWMDSFDARADLDPRAFERYVRELKAKQP